MPNEYKKLFSHIAAPQPSSGLLSTILNRIQYEQQRLSVQRHLIFFSSGTIGSIIALAFGTNMLIANSTESGFISFLSLLFSDSKVMLTYWQNIGFALLETLPTTGVIILLVATLVLLGSIKKMARDIAFIRNLIEH